MGKSESASANNQAKDKKQDRLAEALRANLRRRKDQMRSRQSDDDTPTTDKD